MQFQFYMIMKLLPRAYNKVYNEKSRQIGIRHSYVKQQINKGGVIISYVKSNESLAIPFTKGLAEM